MLVAFTISLNDCTILAERTILLTGIFPLNLEGKNRTTKDCLQIR
jgi:hypothetical protein